MQVLSDNSDLKITVPPVPIGGTAVQISVSSRFTAHTATPSNQCCGKGNYYAFCINYSCDYFILRWFAILTACMPPPVSVDYYEGTKHRCSPLSGSIQNKCRSKIKILISMVNIGVISTVLIYLTYFSPGPSIMGLFRGLMATTSAP